MLRHLGQAQSPSLNNPGGPPKCEEFFEFFFGNGFGVLHLLHSIRREKLIFLQSGHSQSPSLMTGGFFGGGGEEDGDEGRRGGGWARGG